MCREGETMKNIQYRIPTFYMPVLINADYTGLEKDEDAIIEAFQERVIAEHGPGHWAYDGDDEGYFSHTNDVEPNMGSVVHDIKFITMRKGVMR